MKRTAPAVVIIGLIGLFVAVVRAADVKVTPVVNDGKVFASFAAPSALSADAFEIVKSGILTTLTYVVELRRPSTVWFDRTLASSTLASSVKYDTLTRVYQISKLQEGRVIWSDRTSQEDEMRNWVTTFERVLLDVGEPLESNVEYYVQVRLRTTPRRAFVLWPFTHDDAAGRKAFTFIR